MFARRSGFYPVDYRHINLNIVPQPADELRPDRFPKTVRLAGSRSPEENHADRHVVERLLDELELANAQRHQAEV